MVGLKVNASKTKAIRIRFPAKTGSIIVKGEFVERVTAFPYLGSLITTTVGTQMNCKLSGMWDGRAKKKRIHL